MSPTSPPRAGSHPGLKNRLLIATSAVGIHISIGAVYAYSVYTKPLRETFGWSYEKVGLAFSIAIVFLGLSAAFLGRFIERRGPRAGGMLSASCYAGGLILAGFAMQTESVLLFYLGYGVLGGIGLGVGYISPVSTLVKWFPDRRGMATGLAIMGFGFGALLGGPVIGWLIGTVGLATTFWVQAAVYFTIMMASARYIAPPPPDWQPAGMASKPGGAVLSGGALQSDLAQLKANEAILTRRFYFLWVMLFINVTCGIAVLSVASPMAQEISGLTAVQAATMVGLLGLFNGLGRITWASFSDVIGRPATYMAFFGIQIVAFLVLPSITHALLFQVVLFLIMTCYGGGFATIPAYIGDLFGTKELSAIHGYLLTAWSAAGLAGPMTVAAVRDHTGSFSGTLYLFVGLFVVALIVSIWTRWDIHRIRARNLAAAPLT
jgi:OFA family oxalate/formate antiporter-like MFS transporter